MVQFWMQYCPSNQILLENVKAIQKAPCCIKRHNLQCELAALTAEYKKLDSSPDSRLAVALRY